MVQALLYFTGSDFDISQERGEDLLSRMIASDDDASTDATFFFLIFSLANRPVCCSYIPKRNQLCDAY
jgi:hypothetical protein